MKRLILICLLILIATPALAQWTQDTQVKGYQRHDGANVQPYHRTMPDDTRFNNYSTQGNTNPYTGQMGTVDPYRQQNDPYSSSQPHRQTWP